jgi:choline dehydrogenase-like flavoprotein
VHSTSGAVKIALPGNLFKPDNRVIATTKEFSSDFPFNLDLNSGNSIGVGWLQASCGGGVRSSSATAYIEPNQDRPNLTVLLGAQATKLIQTGTTNGVPRFGSVQFAVDKSSTRLLVTANKEIIVSAGVFNTPQLLMLSGIGDKNALAKVGINTIVNLPGVGQNMTDHPLLAHNYLVNNTETFDNYLGNSLVSNVADWENTHKGPLAFTVANQLAFLRVNSSDPIYKRFKDPSTGKTSGHFEFLFGNGFFMPGVTEPSTGNYFAFLTQIMSPSSRGSVTLASSDPLAAPVINPNWLGDDFDINTMLTALKASKKFMTGKAWKDYVISPYGDFANANTDAELIAYARANTGTIWHASSTAAMTCSTCSWGVTNPDLRVKGTAGLRVVDASALTYVPSMHPQGVVYALAERAADIIKSQNA